MRLTFICIIRRILWGAAAVAFSAAANASATGQDELFRVRAEGYAEGSGPFARDQAIENAKREVVEKVAKSLLASGDLEPLRPLFRRAANYVSSYDLLRQDRTGETTRVEIDAYVSEKLLRQDVAALMFPRLPAPPKVQLLIGEQLPSDKIIAVPDAGLAESVLREGLSGLKLCISGGEALGRLFNQAQLIAIVTGGVAEGQQFALANQADVAVVGAAVVTTEGNEVGGGVYRCRASVNLRVHRGYDGKMMDSLTATAVVSGADPAEGGDQAVRDACAKLVRDTAVSSILAVLATQASDAVLITLENPGNRAAFDELLTHLEVSLNLDRVEELFYSASRARLRVPYDGPMAYLTDIIADGTYSGKKLEPLRVVGRDMTFAFQ